MLALQALTFELRIMARKKRMLLCQHKTGFKKIIKFKMGAQEAKPGQPLAPLLGQVQINVGEFVNYFNIKTTDYPKGLRLHITLFVKWDKTYSIEIGKIHITRLLYLFIYEDVDLDYNQEHDEYSTQMYESKNYKISLVDFLKLVKIYALNHHINLEKSFSVLYNQLHLFKVRIDMADHDEYTHALFEVFSKIRFNRLALELLESK